MAALPCLMVVPVFLAMVAYIPPDHPVPAQADVQLIPLHWLHGWSGDMASPYSSRQQPFMRPKTGAVYATARAKPVRITALKFLINYF